MHLLLYMSKRPTIIIGLFMRLLHKKIDSKLLSIKVYTNAL